MGTRSEFNRSSFSLAHIRNRERSSTSQKNNEPRFHCSTTSVFLTSLSQGVSEGSFCLMFGPDDPLLSDAAAFQNVASGSQNGAVWVPVVNTRSDLQKRQPCTRVMLSRWSFLAATCSPCYVQGLFTPLFLRHTSP